MSSVERLQINNRHWRVMPDIPKTLVHAMTVGHKQCIYVFGGRDMMSNDSKSCYEYDTLNQSCRQLSDMPAPCELGSAVVNKSMIYLVGGFGQTCMAFNPALNLWNILCKCRYQHADAPALVWKHKILICGGRSNQEKDEDGEPGSTSVIEEYEPETDRWTVSQIELPKKLDSHFVFATDQTTCTITLTLEQDKPAHT